MAVREQVSGPGSQSKRTDMNVSKQPVRYMSGGTYGEGQELLQQQAGADLYAAPSSPETTMTDAARRNIMASMSPVAKLTDPSTRPSEPVTAGMTFGPGVGFEKLNLPQPSVRNVAAIANDLISQGFPEVAEISNFLSGSGRGYGY
jgi:hypothetical protein